MTQSATATNLECSIDLEAILTDGNTNYPFNNIATTCRLMEEAGLPEKLGGDCYDQVTRMIEKIRGAGQEALYIAAGYHFGILTEGSERAYLDPTLSMRDPMYLDELSSEKPLRANTYPVVQDKSSFLSVNLTGDILRSEWNVPRPGVDGNAEIPRMARQTNEFDLRRATDGIDYNPDVVRKFFHDYVRTLAWNTVTPETGEVITLSLGVEGAVSARSSELKNRLTSGTDDCEKRLHIVAKTTGLTRAELDEFLELGQAKFRELKARPL
ncbi:MAG: hypothetical protein Q8P68_04650 [Candidatus Peregrinibacteria bacterium]|nr:hypothetical protein [Candidatus Peregrinibacteria bacterium]MDZ4244671.1 hypothetical protein [Candidatus Gracilibacteria bacterium]